MFSHTTIIDRPDQSTEFWHHSPQGNIPAIFTDLKNAQIAAGKIISINETVSPDGLHFERVVVYSDEAAFQETKATVESMFPGNIASRATYCAANGHTLQYVKATI